MTTWHSARCPPPRRAGAWEGSICASEQEAIEATAKCHPHRSPSLSRLASPVPAVSELAMWTLMTNWSDKFVGHRSSIWTAATVAGPAQLRVKRSTARASERIAPGLMYKKPGDILVQGGSSCRGPAITAPTPRASRSVPLAPRTSAIRSATPSGRSAKRWSNMGIWLSGKASIHTLYSTIIGQNQMTVTRR
jgi:hypothetical protein